MTVHHVYVDHPGAGGEHLIDLRAESREVSRQDGRRDQPLDKEIRHDQPPLGRRPRR
jgi:hypothetical protein